MFEFDPVLIQDWFFESARRHPEREAVVVGKERWTYGALAAQVDAMACNLMEMGVKPGDRVIIFMDTCAEIIISIYAILRAGGVFVVLNGSVKAPKLRFIMDNSGAVALIAQSTKSEVVAEAVIGRSAPCMLIWAGDISSVATPGIPSLAHWNEIQAGQGKANQTARFPRRIDRDLAALIYTSGSTGEPKGVMSCHHSVVSAARSIIQYVGNRENDIVMVVLPLSFDYGLYQVIMAFMYGGTIVLVPSFAFPHLVLEQIPRERITGFPVVPTLVAMLLRMQDLSRYDLSSLRYITNTGAALPIEHIRQLSGIFPRVTIFSMFGLTECKRVCYLPPEELYKRPASVGKAMPNCSVRVVDETGRDVPPGETGELVIRGSNLMQGYWGDPELTARTYRQSPDGGDKILYSGDYFKMDEDGFLYFLGRKDSMIKSKGERISPKEIENIICGMKEVSEAVVTGVPDTILGQAIKAFIVPMPGVQLTEQSVLEHCSKNMESYMVPKFIQFMDKLPRSAHGKIDNRMLAQTSSVSETVSSNPLINTEIRSTT